MLALVFGIFSLFSLNGFVKDPQSSALPDTVRLSPKKKIDTATYVTINRIFIIGNKITRDAIILRELSLKQGDVVISRELLLILDRDKKKLFNTRLFHTTDVRPLELEPGKVDLLVEVSERWYTFPSPRFELSDRNINEWWENYNHDFNRVIYGMKLYQYNMRGRNETLLITALFGFQRKFSVSYRMPYIDKKKKQGLIFDFDFSESKNLAYKTEEHILTYLKSRELQKVSSAVGLTYTFRNSFYQTHALRAEYATNWISDSISALNPNYFRTGKDKQRYATLAYQFTSEHRDVVAYPLQGYQVIAALSKAGLGFGDDVNKFDASLTYSKYIDLKRDFYFSNYSDIYWSTQKDVPYTHYGGLGYRRQFVKGYEIYVIEGPYYFLNKSTLKKRILARKYNWGFMPSRFEYLPLSIYLKTYADLGYVKNYPYYEKNNYNTALTNKLLGGIGGGLDIVASYDLVVRLEYTFNIQGKNGFYLHIKKEF